MLALAEKLAHRLLGHADPVGELGHARAGEVHLTHHGQVYASELLVARGVQADHEPLLEIAECVQQQSPEVLVPPRRLRRRWQPP